MAVPVLLLPVLLGLQDAAPAAAPEAPLGTFGAPDDTSLRAAWSRLDPGERREAAEWLRLELSGVDSYQARLLRQVLAQEPEDPGLWPTVPEETPFFEPEVHAPGLPIARERLDPAGSRARRAVRQLVEPPPEGLPSSAWVYDWGTRSIRRSGVADDPELLFENALRGYPPDLDLAHALALRALDGGEEQRALDAFAHAYTDRKGNVYPLTLFDAWGSGEEIEMPDVDTLGIVHAVLDEWERWQSPVPGTEHRELYDTVGELFFAARRYRDLRVALADCLLVGKPVPRGGYGPMRVNLHALWDAHGSRPAELARVLPDAAGWQAFVDGWVERCKEEPELWERGKKRRDELHRDGLRVRGRLVWILGQLGALEAERAEDRARR